MKISSSNFYSGVNVNSHKKNSKTGEQHSKQIEAQNKEPHQLKAYSQLLTEYQQSSGRASKYPKNYSDQRAIDQYQTLENLEKREYAQSALGFSIYA